MWFLSTHTALSSREKLENYRLCFKARTCGTKVQREAGGFNTRTVPQTAMKHEMFSQNITVLDQNLCDRTTRLQNHEASAPMMPQLP
ncbi:hypothetical protein FQA47_014516 [Oryzias melastigma]|uniref:Uncharacterized protein n=1 Tax=Oryzias melastigma TaxID=30732 RepID=A0A834C7X0_ORYME|nr:hypothetical protein FQA47_014516 [Oryzias melastigma]